MTIPHAGGKIIHFLPVEHTVQLKGKIDQPQGRIPALWRKLENTAIVVSHKADLPVIIKIVGEVSLDIGKIRLVFSVNVQGS